MTIKGYADQAKTEACKTQFATVNPVREQQYGVDVIAHAFTQRIGTDTAETGSTTRIIKATAHAAIKGDVIGFTAGTLDNSEYRVDSVTTDYITLTEVMRVAPSNGDAFEILRQRSAVLGGDGSLGVSFTNDTNYGVVGATTLRSAAQIGNATGAADFGAGAVGAQVLRTTPASDSPHLLATRHEAVATPLSARLSDGTDFIVSAALAAAQKTISTATKMLTSLAVMVGWDGTTHREIAVDTSGNVKVANLPATADTNTGAAGASTLRAVLATRHEAVATPLAAQLSNGTAAVAYDSGAAGATVLRTVLATRHEAAATPVATRTGNGTNFDDYNAGAATAATPRVAIAATNVAYTAKGKIAGSALTGSYATLLNPTSDLRIIYILNSCNDTIMVSLDGGTTDSFELESGESVTVDLAANGMKFDNAVNISSKHAGAAPTAGSVRASGVG